MDDRLSFSPKVLFNNRDDFSDKDFELEEELSQLDCLSSIGTDLSKAGDSDDDLDDADGDDITIDGKLNLILRQKDEEIDLLKQEIKTIKSTQRRFCTHGYSCKCDQKSPSQSHIIKDLKIEFEKSLKNLKLRRIQVTKLQEQLIQACNENSELKKQLREKERNNDRKDHHYKNIEEIEMRLKDHYEKKLAETRALYEESQNREIDALKDTFLENLNEQVSVLVRRLKNLSRSNVHSTPTTANDDLDFENIFSPLKVLWSVIVDNYSEKMKALEMKRINLEEAHKSLEESVQEAKNLSRSNASSLSDYLEDSQRYRQIVEKLEKYRKHYNRFKKKYEQEMENLKNSCSDKLTNQLTSMLSFSPASNKSSHSLTSDTTY